MAEIPGDVRRKIEQGFECVPEEVRHYVRLLCERAYWIGRCDQLEREVAKHG